MFIATTFPEMCGLVYAEVDIEFDKFDVLWSMEVEVTRLIGSTWEKTRDELGDWVKDVDALATQYALDLYSEEGWLYEQIHWKE